MLRLGRPEGEQKFGNLEIFTTPLIVAELNTRIREDLRLLTSLSESLALLDMMVNSFANLISTKPAETYVRPEFTGTSSEVVPK